MTAEIRLLAGSGAARTRLNPWLLASVGLNLVLIGILVAWTVQPPPRRQPFVTWQRELLGSLGAGDAQIVSQAADRIEAEQIAAEPEVVAGFARVRGLLRAGSLDRRSLSDALDDVARARAAQQAETFRLLTDELLAVSADGRAKIADAMDREGQRRRLKRDR